MASDNPFSYGNPISDPQRFFGRRQEAGQIFSRLRNPEFESSSVIGARRMGKTSLFNFMSHPDVVRSHGLDPATCLFVYLDLQMVGSSGTPLRLYQHLLRRLQAKLQDQELKQFLHPYVTQDSLDTFDLSDIFDAIDERDLRVVLLLDEFENIAANTYFGPDFYYGLRSLAIHHNLALVTASQRDLVDLSHSEDIRSSPFFNIFTNVHLRPFVPQEAQELIEGSLRGNEVSFTDNEVALLVELAGGTPFFLQMGAHFLFNAYQESGGASSRWDLLEAVFAAEVHPHLLSYWQSVSNEERTLLTVLAALEAGGSAEAQSWSISQMEKWFRRSGSVMPALIRRGLVVETSQRFRLFSPTFTDFIVQEVRIPAAQLPGLAEAREQEMTALASLGEPLRTRVGRAVNQMGTEYRELFLAWMSDPATAEATLDMLTGPEGIFPAPAEVTERPSQQPTHSPDAAARRAVAESKEEVTDWEDVELVLTPRPEPATLLWLYQWLTDTAQGEVEEMAATGPSGADLSLRVFFYQPVPLVDMLSALPAVVEVREGDPEVEGEHRRLLKRRMLISRTTLRKVTVEKPSKRLYVVFKATATPEPPPAEGDPPC